MPLIEQLIERIKQLTVPNNRPVLIAISGFGGSGKSTLAEKLKEHLQDAQVISIDAFIVDQLNKRSSDWEGFDRNRFKQQVLDPAIHGEPIKYRRYSWPGNKIVGWQAVPKSPYLILEGCSLLHPDLLPYYNFTVWIDCPLDLATKRGMERDRSWGVDHDELWHTVWMPNEQDFFDKYRPDATVDFHYRSPNVHHMKLDDKSFKKMKSGSKISELRLNDKKRQLIKVGDIIEFTNRENLDEKIVTEITSLQTYPTFKDLYHGVKADYPDWKEEPFIRGMYEYYSPEEEREYGALEIGIRLIN